MGSELSKHRESVLIISTDPAHNLSDSFGQKFANKPVLVNGYENLYCMEYENQSYTDDIDMDLIKDDFKKYGAINDLFKNMPGIEDAFGYIALIKKTLKMDYSVIIFDTAPTGHTLKLLSYPTLLKESYNKLIGSSIGTMFKTMVSMVLTQQNNIENKLDKIIANINTVNEKLANPKHTTFVCVCIPEFLSVFETERLIQSLYSYEIDSHIIFVNQIIWNNGHCSFCKSRQKMQEKYLDMIDDLYLDIDFDIVHIPLLETEVRKQEKIKEFSKLLYNVQEYEDATDEFPEEQINTNNDTDTNDLTNTLLEKELNDILDNALNEIDSEYNKPV